MKRSIGLRKIAGETFNKNDLFDMLRSFSRNKALIGAGTGGKDEGTSTALHGLIQVGDILSDSVPLRQIDVATGAHYMRVTSSVFYVALTAQTRRMQYVCVSYHPCMYASLVSHVVNSTTLS